MLQMISDEAPASRLKKKPITVSVIKSNYKKLLSTYIAVGRPSMSEFNSLLDQLVFNGIIKRQSSKKSKDLDQVCIPLFFHTLDLSSDRQERHHWSVSVQSPVESYFPKEKEFVEKDGIKFIIEETEKNRIEKIRIEIKNEKDKNEDDIKK